MYAKDPESKDGKESLEMALHTLKMMARGGIHDHIAKVIVSLQIQFILAYDQGLTVSS